MSLNWRQAGINVGQGMTQLGQTQISAELQAQRDKNLSRYRREEMTLGHEQNTALQDDRIDAENFQTHVRTIGEQQSKAQKLAADQQAAELKREQDLLDSQREQEYEQENIRLRARLNPSKGVNVTTNVGAGEKAYNKKFSETLAVADGAMYDKVRAEVNSASSMEDNLKVMEEVMATADTGATPELLNKLGKYLGTDSSTAMQTFQGASTPIVLGLADKLTGVISDNDMKVIEAGAPSFGKNPEANKKIIEILRKGIARSKKNYASMNAYLEKSAQSETGYSLRGWQPPHTKESINSEAVDIPGNQFAPIVSAPSEEAISQTPPAQETAASPPASTVKIDFDAWKANRPRQ